MNRRRQIQPRALYVAKLTAYWRSSAQPPFAGMLWNQHEGHWWNALEAQNAYERAGLYFTGD